MRITKDINVSLSEYDDFNQIGIVYYNNTHSGINSFVFYSNDGNENYLSKMSKSHFVYISKISVKKNSDFYFSVLDDNFSNRSKNYHLHLGKSSEDCFVVCEEKTYSKIQAAMKEDVLKDIKLIDEKKYDEYIEDDFDTYFDDDFETETKALTVVKDSSIQETGRRHLRFSYKLNKKIRIMLIKLYRLMPSFITGDYRRRINL